MGPRCVPWTSLICTRVHTHNLSHTERTDADSGAGGRGGRGGRAGFLSWPYVIRAVAKRRLLIAAPPQPSREIAAVCLVLLWTLPPPAQI